MSKDPEAAASRSESAWLKNRELEEMGCQWNCDSEHRDSPVVSASIFHSIGCMLMTQGNLLKGEAHALDLPWLRSLWQLVQERWRRPRLTLPRAEPPEGVQRECMNKLRSPGLSGLLGRVTI